MPLRKSETKPKLKLAGDPTLEWSFEAIGTQWWIGVYQTVADRTGLQLAVAERIEQFDKTYSRFRADSLVTRIASKSGNYKFPKDSEKLFGLYRKLYDVTKGAVTPLIGQTLSDAGYNASYSLQPKQLVTPPLWDSVMQFKDRELATSQPVLLDFGAAGKGYLVDLIGEVLQSHKVEQYCIDAGGDMLYHSGNAQMQIGLEHPTEPGQVIGVAELQNQALCGSAGNRRAWAGYHHILNPFTLHSPSDILAVWVVANSVLLADGLTTALFFAKPDILQSFMFSYVIVYADQSVVYSDDFSGEIYTNLNKANP